MVAKVENINTNILRQCRQQMGLSIADVIKNLSKIEEFEEGERKPTFNQLNILSELYNVPRWVFISDSLPEQYHYSKAVPAFRQFSTESADLFGAPKVRSLTTRVEQFRNLILELREDMGEPVAEITLPAIQGTVSPAIAAKQVREWLGLVAGDSLDFSHWKRMLEDKGIFIFMTSKYKGWSHIDTDLLRGLAIYHSSLPIIIINDSDANKAQSFSLLHELGHLLREKSAIDTWEDYHQQVEKWCDELAGNVLMPFEPFQTAVGKIGVNDLATVKILSNEFKASPYACLVRLRQCQIITQAIYLEFEFQLKKEYGTLRRRLQESSGGPARNRPQEVLKQYGHIYTRTLIQAYNNQEIGLHKLSRAFDLKRVVHVLELCEQL